MRGYLDLLIGTLSMRVNKFDKNTGNYDNLLKQNIIVDYIPRKLDISTTNIINKIILNYSNEKK